MTRIMKPPIKIERINLKPYNRIKQMLILSSWNSYLSPYYRIGREYLKSYNDV